MKYLNLFREQFKSRTTFTIKDVKKVLSQKKISSSYIHVLLNHLTKKGEIKKIAKGIYTVREELEVVGFAFSPFYYGLQEALSLRKLWEQEVNPVIISTRKVRNGIRKFLGNNYLIKRIDRRMFFGFEMIKYYDIWIPVSDIEKTLIDFIYFRQNLPKEVIVEMKNSIRIVVFDAYLKRVPKWVRKRVMKLMGNEKLWHKINRFPKRKVSQKQLQKELEILGNEA